MGSVKSDEILMVICSETPWSFETEPESGELLESCFYSELANLGYTSNSLSIADERDTPSIDYLYRKIYPARQNDPELNKMHPDCLNLVSIIQKCEIKQAILA